MLNFNIPTHLTAFNRYNAADFLNICNASYADWVITSFGKDQFSSMALFKTAPLEIFDEPMPGGTFPDPEIVGHFSVEGNGEIAFDESKKKFLVMPGNLKKVKFDLNEGYEDIAEIPEHQLNNIDYILRWIQEDRET